MKLFLTSLSTVIMITLLTITALANDPLHGNARSRVFHNSNCRYYDCPNCYIIFNSRKEAIEAGFRPCGICRG